VSARVCPTCAGAWLYSLTFDHGPDCALRAADDATVAADHERLMFSRPGYALVRPATPPEQSLAVALGMPPWTLPAAAPPLHTLVSPVTGSITRRRFQYGDNGTVFDPDAAVTP